MTGARDSDETLAAAIRALSPAKVGDSPTMGREEFLRVVGAQDGTAFGNELLASAISERDGEASLLANKVLFKFGLSEESLVLFERLGWGDWHWDHEDVAEALAHNPRVEWVPLLRHLAVHVPEYLDWDEAHALGTKSVHALANIPGPEAKAALEELVQVGAPPVRERAIELLAKRDAGPAGDGA